MIGAIAGDVIGSAYEAGGYKHYDFPLFSEWSKFTDDTVVTIAVARALLDNREYRESILDLCRQYPLAGYGQSFERWLHNPETGPYDSWGNGGAMRVSPIGFSAHSTDDVLVEAKKAVEMTHNHPEGIKGAQATAMCIYLAREGADKVQIREAIQERFDYDLSRTVEEIRPQYSFDVASHKSVPESITCFLEATDYESTIRNVVSLGGDTDTMACIAGGMAQAYWKTVPHHIVTEVRQRLPRQFLDIIDQFSERNGVV